MGNPKLIVDGGSFPPPAIKDVAPDDDRTILVKGDNDVSHNPAEVVVNRSVTFFPLFSNQSITITFNGSNPFGWSSNTRAGVQGKPLKVTGLPKTYYYEARLKTTASAVSGSYPLQLVVK